MAVKVRIDYVRPRRGGDAYGISSQAIQEVVATSETISVDGASVQSAIAPEFPNDDRGEAGGVFARMSCASGAVIATEAAVNPLATELGGIWIAAEPVLLPIEPGWRFAFIKAIDQPVAPAGGGGGGPGDATANNQIRTHVLLGDPDAPVPASDVAAASLNGRLARISQRLSTLLLRLPAVLGLRPQAESFPVTLSVENKAVLEAIAANGVAATYMLLAGVSAVGNGPPIGGVKGGSYIWTVVGALNGSVATLRALGPDGAAWIVVATAGAPGSAGVVVGEGATLQCTLEGGAPAAVYSSLT